MNINVKDFFKLIGVLITALLLAYGGYVGVDSLAEYLVERDRKADFKVGDCVKDDFSNEFETHIAYHKVLKVGKAQYLVKMRYHDAEGYMYGNMVKTKSYFNEYELVDGKFCP